MSSNNPYTLSVPDNQGPQVNITPKAKQIDGLYMMPTIQRIPDAPTENMAGQLANALSSIQPTLTNVTSQMVTEEKRREEAEAYAVVQAAQAKNVEDLKEAQIKGLIPDGAAPNFIRAVHTSALKLSGERATSSLQDAYSQADDVRNSDDPNAFDQFISKWKATRIKVDMEGEDGKPRYTAVEIHGARYYEQIDHTVAALKSQHVAHRVSEREKLATQTAGDLVQTRLDAAFDHTVDPPDFKKVAASLNAAFYDPTGLVQYGGMRASKANEILAESIITKAISAGDESILEVAKFIGPNETASLANTKIFRDKAEAARQHIATSKWMNEERDRKRAEYKGQGLDSLEAVEARAREDRARVMEQYATEKMHREQYAKQVQKHEAVEPEIKAIIRLHAINGDTTSKEIRDSLKVIAGADPDAYRQMVNWLQTEGRQSKVVDEKTSLQTFTKLRAQISDDPTKFDSRLIVKEANAGHITAGQVSDLFNHVDSVKKQAREFPLMQSPLIQGLRQDLRGAVGQGPLDDFGVGRLRSDQAAAELNGLIAGYLRSHKNATEYDLYEAIQPMVEKLARKHSPDLNESLSAQERARDPRRTKLDEQLKEKYPNKTQRDQVINQLLSR